MSRKASWEDRDHAVEGFELRSDTLEFGVQTWELKRWQPLTSHFREDSKSSEKYPGNEAEWAGGGGFNTI